MHDGTSFDCGHYISDLLDVNTGIWWHYDDEKIIQIIYFPSYARTRESNKKITKKKVMWGSYKLLLLVYIRTINLVASRNIFDK